jgi:NAD(P)-dependent dehydrogenase (short-subunit alcohol dehydrogenase family)
MDQLAGKVAVITGGARGIGRALAEAFLSEGMRVMLGDLDPVGLRTTADELSAHGDVRGVEIDVTDRAAVDALRDATIDAFGTAHVVCNNAGVSGRRHAMAETTDADWDWVVGVNLMGVVHGIRSFAPLLQEQDEGHVVNTASLAGLSAVPFAAPYVATKHAVFGLSQSLALEFATRGSAVGVTVLCPDWLNTDIAESHSNWPTERLGARPADASDPAVQFVDSVFVDAVAQAPGPAAYARKVVDAVRANQFLVLTETPLVEQALETHARVLQGDRPSIPM